MRERRVKGDNCWNAVKMVVLVIEERLCNASFFLSLTNDDLVALLEGIGRDLQVERCGSLADTAGNVIMGSVARAVPTSEITSLANGDTSQVGADTCLH
jgi:hypothetical protein